MTKDPSTMSREDDPTLCAIILSERDCECLHRGGRRLSAAGNADGTLRAVLGRRGASERVTVVRMRRPRLEKARVRSRLGTGWPTGHFAPPADRTSRGARRRARQRICRVTAAPRCWSRATLVARWPCWLEAMLRCSIPFHSRGTLGAPLMSVHTHLADAVTSLFRNPSITIPPVVGKRYHTWYLELDAGRGESDDKTETEGHPAVSHHRLERDDPAHGDHEQSRAPVTGAPARLGQERQDAKGWPEGHTAQCNRMGTRAAEQRETNGSLRKEGRIRP